MPPFLSMENSGLPSGLGSKLGQLGETDKELISRVLHASLLPSLCVLSCPGLLLDLSGSKREMCVRLIVPSDSVFILEWLHHESLLSILI